MLSCLQFRVPVTTLKSITFYNHTSWSVLLLIYTQQFVSNSCFFFWLINLPVPLCLTEKRQRMNSCTLLLLFFFFYLQVLMWRQWSTRTSASQCGTWAVRTKSDPCGDTTFRTHKVNTHVLPHRTCRCCFVAIFFLLFCFEYWMMSQSFNQKRDKYLIECAGGKKIYFAVWKTRNWVTNRLRCVTKTV